MAQVRASKPTERNPVYIVRLKREIREGLDKVGVGSAKVDFERIQGTKLFRFRVIAAALSKLTHSERQDLVWRMVGRTLRDDEQIFISTIVTLTLSEASGRAAA